MELQPTDEGKAFIIGIGQRVELRRGMPEFGIQCPFVSAKEPVHLTCVAGPDGSPVLHIATTKAPVHIAPGGQHSTRFKINPVSTAQARLGDILFLVKEHGRLYCGFQLYAAACNDAAPHKSSTSNQAAEEQATADAAAGVPTAHATADNVCKHVNEQQHQQQSGSLLEDNQFQQYRDTVGAAAMQDLPATLEPCIHFLQPVPAINTSHEQHEQYSQPQQPEHLQQAVQQQQQRSPPQQAQHHHQCQEPPVPTTAVRYVAAIAAPAPALAAQGGPPGSKRGSKRAAPSSMQHAAQEHPLTPVTSLPEPLQPRSSKRSKRSVSTGADGATRAAAAAAPPAAVVKASRTSRADKRSANGQQAAAASGAAATAAAGQAVTAVPHAQPPLIFNGMHLVFWDNAFTSELQRIVKVKGAKIDAKIKPGKTTHVIAKFGTTAEEAAKHLEPVARELHFSPRPSSFPGTQAHASDAVPWPLPSGIRFVRREFLSDSNKAGYRLDESRFLIDLQKKQEKRRQQQMQQQQQQQDEQGHKQVQQQHWQQQQQQQQRQELRQEPMHDLEHASPAVSPTNAPSGGKLSPQSPHAAILPPSPVPAAAAAAATAAAAPAVQPLQQHREGPRVVTVRLGGSPHDRQSLDSQAWHRMHGNAPGGGTPGSAAAAAPGSLAAATGAAATAAAAAPVPAVAAAPGCGTAGGAAGEEGRPFKKDPDGKVRYLPRPDEMCQPGSLWGQDGRWIEPWDEAAAWETLELLNCHWRHKKPKAQPDAAAAEGGGGVADDQSEYWSDAGDSEGSGSAGDVANEACHVACRRLGFCIVEECRRTCSMYGNTAKDQFRKKPMQHAIKVLEGLQHAIVSNEDVDALELGPKTADKLKEIVATGRLQRNDWRAADEQRAVVAEFSKAWGFAEATAQRFYEQGCRTLDDLRKLPNLTAQQKVGLKYFDDFNQRIPRREVEQVQGLVRQATIEAICKLNGCTPGEVTSKRLHCRAVGSFLRGKEDCGDIDMLISPPPELPVPLDRLLVEVVQRLLRQGLLTDDLLPDPGAAAQALQRGGSRQGLTFMGVYKAPGSGTFRRIDIKVYPFHVLPLAVSYFASSTNFCRALRHWCNTPNPSVRALAQALNPMGNCFKLSDKILTIGRRDDNRRQEDVIELGPKIDCKCEADLFRAVGLAPVPLHMRDMLGST